ncbi:Trk system potassium uptake protein TrkG [Sporotomaculum syntrophicum]|uniref:Trk system potassium uptake protein TrkG n=1 Tax=Sporotomaculum syntrophicum TaxID=182264 RepID=A0A9D2WTN6_9FIRM|nr:TrkH family potassium uptake protein [Sporotomaculum syntrophicum]KAF1086721.1 Trk system potassium uptake protein TrkG [Sporotomaculum syntrophicum]
MNRPLVLRALGLVLLFEAGSLLPALGIALYLQEKAYLAFVLTILLLTFVGLPLSRRQIPVSDVGYREGFVIASASWLLMALFGALPYLVSGAIPGFIDALFEAMSGFTTTGATVLKDIESLPKSILFWRSTTHWLGGMGIIVLTLALIPSLKIAGLKLFRAEVPGPNKSKVLPRVAQTARELYKLYIIVTVACLVALKIAGLNWFDSFIHTFSCVGTGGFSNYNASTGALNNPAAEYIMIFFMFICGMNFTLHYHAIRGNFSPLWRDPETKLYLAVTLTACLFISINLVSMLGYSVGTALRQSAFQTVSILTTTGLTTADYTLWPTFSQGVIFLLMFIGGCAGSTAGGIKNVRYLILAKSAFRQVAKLIHPKAVIPVRLGRSVISEELVENVQSFFFLYFGLLFLCTLMITAMGVDLFSALSAVASSLGNVGPGFGMVGSTANYTAIPEAGRLLCAICMLIGRLEIYTILVFFSARLWRS